jgi:hypothetical protein
VLGLLSAANPELRSSAARRSVFRARGISELPGSIQKAAFGGFFEAFRMLLGN